MIEVVKEGILLKKTKLKFENSGVLNPAAIREGKNVHIFYRAVEKGNRSSIGYCKLEGPLKVIERWRKPIIVPEFDYESQGVEDGRIVKLDDKFYLSYTSYDGINARGALAISDDRINFIKQGIIVPAITCAEFVYIAESAGRIRDDYYRNPKFNYQSDPEARIILWDKNVVFFPRRINGKLAFLHRIRPGIQIVEVNNMNELNDEFWAGYFMNFDDHILLDPLNSHESSYVGGGCPPVETEQGWILIYHGVEKTVKGLVYSACAALLDLNNPRKVLARLPYALFSPEKEWEITGEVNNVVFPTGTVIFGDTLYIYYGAADSVIAVASVKINDLISELLSFTGSFESQTPQKMYYQ
jgi:predicted GH43/DUF377 family glycosyl hydrolase